MKSRGSASVVLLLILVMLIFGMFVYYWRPRLTSVTQDNEVVMQEEVSVTPDPKESDANLKARAKVEIGYSADGLTQKYINNEYGFSFTFPKIDRQRTCSAFENNVNLEEVPLKVFEDTEQKSVYVSGVTTPKPMYSSVGYFEYLKGSCKDVKNSLELIKNGYKNGMVDNQGFGFDVTKPQSFQVNYAKVESDDDLLALFNTIYGSSYADGCRIGNKKLLEGETDKYFVSVVDKNGEIGNPEGSCWLNFAFNFMYSAATKTAVVTSGAQGAIFNGTNGQAEPGIEIFR